MFQNGLQSVAVQYPTRILTHVGHAKCIDGPRPDLGCIATVMCRLESRGNEQRSLRCAATTVLQGNSTQMSNGRFRCVARGDDHNFFAMHVSLFACANLGVRFARIVIRECDDGQFVPCRMCWAGTAPPEFHSAYVDRDTSEPPLIGSEPNKGRERRAACNGGYHLLPRCAPSPPRIG